MTNIDSTIALTHPTHGHFKVTSGFLLGVIRASDEAGVTLPELQQAITDQIGMDLGYSDITTRLEAQIILAYLTGGAAD